MKPCLENLISNDTPLVVVSSIYKHNTGFDSSYRGEEIPCQTCPTWSQFIQDKLEISVYWSMDKYLESKYNSVFRILIHYTPRKLCLWWGILFSRCPSVRLSVRPSVTFCFLNNLKSNCWIFIKLCKNIHICKTNTLNKKVRARGQFY